MKTLLNTKNFINIKLIDLSCFDLKIFENLSVFDKKSQKELLFRKFISQYSVTQSVVYTAAGPGCPVCRTELTQFRIDSVTVNLQQQITKKANLFFQKMTGS